MRPNLFSKQTTCHRLPLQGYSISHFQPKKDRFQAGAHPSFAMRSSCSWRWGLPAVAARAEPKKSWVLEWRSKPGGRNLARDFAKLFWIFVLKAALCLAPGSNILYVIFWNFRDPWQRTIANFVLPHLDRDTLCQEQQANSILSKPQMYWHVAIKPLVLAPHWLNSYEAFLIWGVLGSKQQWVERYQCAYGQSARQSCLTFLTFERYPER